MKPWTIGVIPLKQTKQSNKPDYDLQILQSIRRIIRAIDQHSRRLKLDYHITVPQLVTLTAIAAEGRISTVALARVVHLSPSTIVGILDRLEEKDLIIRERSKLDRRQVEVSLSKVGAKYLKKAPSPLQDRLSDQLMTLPQKEQKQIAESLERIVSLMQAEELEASPILLTESKIKAN